MTGSVRSKSPSRVLFLSVLFLSVLLVMLVVLWPRATAAQDVCLPAGCLPPRPLTPTKVLNPGETVVTPPATATSMASSGATSTATSEATSMPTHTPTVVGPVLTMTATVMATATIPNMPPMTPTPEGNGNGMMATPVPGPPAFSSTDAIVLHAATPAQLIKSGAGLVYYYVGADGSTVTGPMIPSFSDLATMYPSGSSVVSLLNAPNPLSGKQVYVDYLPGEQKIRVSTFYPDNEYDTNKPYIFRFGSNHVIEVEAW